VISTPERIKAAEGARRAAIDPARRRSTLQSSEL
jgi:hypothetical protein